MTSLEELENQCLPISKLKKYATEWVIKVLVIRRSLTKEYKNTNGEGIRWQLILVDEEGTKIQTTLFNKDVHAWNKSFQLNQSYYIINGKLNRPKPNFLSVHKELELAFMNNTEVVEDKSHFKTDQFSNGFITFDEAEKITNGSLFDVVCILLTVKALTGEGRSIRREVIVTNERYDRKVMTLWGDFAEIEGQMLQSLESEKPVLAFCDVKSSIYQGDFVLSTTPVSSLLINPQFEKANNLQKWNDNMKAEKIDVSLMPSRLMQTARQVKISNILNGSLAIVKDMYYKFNATVTDIDSNTDPWYPGCNKCYKRVTVINSVATCTYCRAEDVDYEARYRLKIDVTAEDQFLSITMFDAAKYYFGCNVKEYVLSTSEKKEQSPYYRKMVLSKGKEFSILVKIDRKFPDVDTNMNVIAMEIHEVSKKLPPDQTKVKIPITKQRSKRTKILSDDEKMKGIVAGIPHIEKDIAAVETDIENPHKKNTCKRTNNIKQVIADDNPQKLRIHEVEKHIVLDESDDEAPLIQLQRKRTRKVKGKNIMPYPMEKKIKEEKNNI
ncbi:replication protein A 70 kDa DNA-binding subunit D-like [Solanum pennellii]|uniref:Replication protein A 70 kDa DNA-binding subunit D-like n=1 Tax=Solanum pennellii TaxID=28526 RepID=A0ABM1UY12_SOLPN|nr:replication protein A 70 kDa DNA-binding subunit D-like [Solanum pennellii]XP_027775370.1 replication protein A 70 kDa DNA-binding subunit D-like [Solanum pennellii]